MKSEAWQQARLKEIADYERLRACPDRPSPAALVTVLHYPLSVPAAFRKMVSEDWHDDGIRRDVRLSPRDLKSFKRFESVANVSRERFEHALAIALGEDPPSMHGLTNA